MAAAKPLSVAAAAAAAAASAADDGVLEGYSYCTVCAKVKRKEDMTELTIHDVQEYACTQTCVDEAVSHMAKKEWFDQDERSARPRWHLVTCKKNSPYVATTPIKLKVLWAMQNNGMRERVVKQFGDQVTFAVVYAVVNEPDRRATVGWLESQIFSGWAMRCTDQNDFDVCAQKLALNVDKINACVAELARGGDAKAPVPMTGHWHAPDIKYVYDEEHETAVIAAKEAKMQAAVATLRRAQEELVMERLRQQDNKYAMKPLHLIDFGIEEDDEDEDTTDEEEEEDAPVVAAAKDVVVGVKRRKRLNPDYVKPKRRRRT